ncbi:UBE2G1 [Lepeophtheirus salmonis]|uniref:UBE2G1 n=1 Tax=Lepeophtheirus salmonis TaxID=72036 RepID=A0A7R8CVA7_LEPSM|nr:UBE2G1 [Lepeophtheirus salmonis]CAF2942076.1 UBE2G1 [Lepeophtheirus salmonis]
MKRRRSRKSVAPSPIKALKQRINSKRISDILVFFRDKFQLQKENSFGITYSIFSMAGDNQPHCQASLLLRKQLAELSKNPVEGFSAGLIDDSDIFKWEVLIIGPSDTLYEGGFFKCHLYFPKEYPLRPPKLKVITEIWHPNIEKNGDVCISILHEPGDDRWGYEKANPNDESPANVDAAKEWRENYPEFKRKVARCVRRSQEEFLQIYFEARHFF